MTATCEAESTFITVHKLLASALVIEWVFGVLLPQRMGQCVLADEGALSTNRLPAGSTALIISLLVGRLINFLTRLIGSVVHIENL